MLMRRILLLAAAVFLGAAPAFATERILTLKFGDDSRRLTAEELLARPDVATITIPNDVTYKRAMTYRAVPMLAVIGQAALDDADTIEARASDGFVSQIPADLVRKAAHGGSVPWIAIEPPDAPWPKIGDHDQTAGPFYLVWEHPGAVPRWQRAVAVRAGRLERRGEPCLSLAAIGGRCSASRECSRTPGSEELHHQLHAVPPPEGSRPGGDRPISASR